MQLPQFPYPEGQQRPPLVPDLMAQFPFWQVLLVWQEPPSAVFATQVPPPSQTRFDRHAVPTEAFDELQTGAPVLQLVVPGLQVLPQLASTVQATQEPAPSQT